MFQAIKVKTNAVSGTEGSCFSLLDSTDQKKFYFTEASKCINILASFICLTNILCWWTILNWIEPIRWFSVGSPSLQSSTLPRFQDKPFQNKALSEEKFMSLIMSDLVMKLDEKHHQRKSLAFASWDTIICFLHVPFSNQMPNNLPEYIEKNEMINCWLNKSSLFIAERTTKTVEYYEINNILWRVPNERWVQILGKS